MAAARIIVIGGPRTGKTTYAKARAVDLRIPVLHTDDLIGRFDWSAASEHIATEWLTQPGPWIVEGVAAVRALRKWLATHPTGTPCDEIVVIEHPRVELSAGQAAMAKGCASIWAGVRADVEARGVVIIQGAMTGRTTRCAAT